MSEDDIARAFEPFFRAERSRNRNTGGMGLGLAVAKRGVDAHGGTITLRNHRSGGLVVSITLPMQ
jgi:two-component system, OmpR family, sensor kinase